MILKASQRGGGQELAVHLMRADDNEHVSVFEVWGFASSTLKEAFKEVEGISHGTKCRQYLFSLSLSPPETARVSAEAFQQAIDRIEARLGLTGQPRAIVFHEKEGRRHAHCAWSRIDAETMTARPLPFFKRRLMDISRELYVEHGWTMPRGVAETGHRDPTNFTLAEWQQAKRQGQDPRWIKQAMQECWAASDNAKAFKRSLEERGYFLAKGDKRSFVVLGFDGEVHSLPRALGLKTKEVAARLGDGKDLASVADTQRQIGERMRPAMRRHIEDARGRFREKAAALGSRKDAMTQRHRAAREELKDRHTQEWQAETTARAARVPRGIAGLWARVTGKFKAIRLQNEAEAAQSAKRQEGEAQSLADAQLGERQELQAECKAVRGAQAHQLLELRREVGRYLSFSRAAEPSAEQRRGVEHEAGRGEELGLGLAR
jgi:hypothetical protein